MGPANGIVLNTTGAGGLTVTGTGAADSGGTIQNSTADGGIFNRGGLANTICNVNGLDFTNLLGTSSVTGATSVARTLFSSA